MDTNIVDNQIDETNDEELVAVIAGAIAASMGFQVPKIRIKKIKRPENSAWTNAAKFEQIN